MLQALIIVFREGFEAFLSVAIIFAYLKKTGRDWLRPAVWWGIAFSVVASFGLGYLLQRVNQPLWEAVLGFVAAILVATFVIHMWRVAPRMKRDMEQKLEQHATSGSRALALLGTFVFTAFMITREGMETALMLIQVRVGRFWLGCALGLAAAAAMSWLWAHFGHRINLKRFFQVTGLFLLLFTAQIVFYSIHELAEAEVLPNSEAIHAATEPYSSDGRYSVWITLGMLTVCAGWLVGSAAVDKARAQRAVEAG
ncbi:MAG: FTR1 family protein [Acidobacteria bacterium]|nr:FTR1 family protein [Acidobacteriota bacterium]MBV9475885.1 FTR1 family protein [Acidobacteriota bacterium]